MRPEQADVSLLQQVGMEAVVASAPHRSGQVPCWLSTSSDDHHEGPRPLASGCVIRYEKRSLDSCGHPGVYILLCSSSTWPSSCCEGSLSIERKPSRCSSSDNSRVTSSPCTAIEWTNLWIVRPTHMAREIVGVLVVETKIRVQQVELLSTGLTVSWKETLQLTYCNCDA